MLDWIRAHEDLLWWLGIASVVTFVGTLALLPALVVRMRADYFVRRLTPDSWPRQHPLMLVGKNVLGVLFVIAGIAMLVLPGQGILTILIGLTLLNFPGKRRLELWLVRIPAVHRAVDWIRRKAGRPSLALPD